MSVTDRALAAVAVDVGRTELREFALPKVPPDGGLLRVDAAGVCGSDPRFYRTKEPGPRILGHENVGTIVRIGELASQRWSVREGDRVALEEFLPCGHCSYCRSGEYRFCPATDLTKPQAMRYGYTPLDVAPSLWGGYARYLYLPPNAVLHRAPEEIPADQVALALPLSNGIQWAHWDGGVGIGQTVVIQGPGPQGLACAIAAKEAGAACVIVSGLSRDAHRLDVARDMCADWVIDVEREDLRRRVSDITNGEMADVVIDTSPGATEPVLAALDIARTGGTIVLGGFKSKPVPEFPSDLIARKRLTIRGSLGHSYAAVEKALRLIESRKYSLGRLCTHRFVLREVDRAIRTVTDDPGAIRVTVCPGED